MCEGSWSGGWGNSAWEWGVSGLLLCCFLWGLCACTSASSKLVLALAVLSETVAVTASVALRYAASLAAVLGWPVLCAMVLHCCNRHAACKLQPGPSAQEDGVRQGCRLCLRLRLRLRYATAVPEMRYGAVLRSL